MIERYTSSPKQSVHPVYCVNERLWYTEEGVSAKSLAILQLKLPGVKIEGYYPNGFTPKLVVPQKVRTILDPLADNWKPKPLGTVTEEGVLKKWVGTADWISTKDPTPRSTHYVPPPAPEPKPEAPKEDLFKEPIEEVEEIPPFLPEPVEFKEVRRHRYQRMVPVNVKVANWKDPARLAMLRTLMASGFSVVDVAKRMDCTRNAIIGACHRNKIPITIREKLKP